MYERAVRCAFVLPDRGSSTRALEHVRLTGATLIIAKLDRLSRDAHFLLGLQKAEVDFVACDMPRLLYGLNS
jgi:hypothetical protein